MKKVFALALLVAALVGTPSALAAAPWCGSGVAATDRVPDNTGGAQVHLLYVVPGDAPERFDVFKDSIADDAALIDSWWRSQDFTRTVRFDAYGFPSCGAGGGVDISLVRLAQPGGAFANDSTRYGAVSAALRSAGWLASGKKYLVYYDGPVENKNLCGTGGGQFAIVWVQTCVQYSDRTAIAAHELLHALGAVPAGAPHRCADSGHICESTGADIMQAYLEPFRPLAQFSLDAIRDDYYGHPDSDSWFDVQTSPYLRHLDQATYPLAVTLRAVAARGWHLASWSGACKGHAACSPSTDADVRVGARFAKKR